MKNMKIFLPILAVVLVLGMTVVGCGNGDDTSSNSVSDIPEFSTTGPYKDYTPITKNDVQGVYNEYINELKSELESQVSQLADLGLKVTMSSSSSGRASALSASSSRTAQKQTYSGDIAKLLKEQDMDIPAGVEITGTVNASFESDDQNIFPIKMNGSADLTVTFTEAFDTEDEFGVVGKIKGYVTVNNVNITDETHYSGSASFGYNCALNLALKEEKKYAKFLTDISASVNLASKTGNVTVKLSIYGDGTDSLLSDTITFKLEPIK